MTKYECCSILFLFVHSTINIFSKIKSKLQLKVLTVGFEFLQNFIPFKIPSITSTSR